MAIAWLGVGRVFLFFPPVKIRKSESRVMPMKLASRTELHTSKIARSYSLRGHLKVAIPPPLSLK